MKKNFTSTWAMLGILIGLVGWYVLYESRYKPELKEKEDNTKKLVTLVADEVTEFKLSRGKTPSIEIKKTGPDWYIVAPIQSKADSVVVSSLLTSVCSAKQERVVDEKPSDLSVFGLKDPQVTISLKKDSTSPSQEIAIGNDTPVAYSLYAKTNQSDEVFKTSRTLKSAIDKDLFALRDKSVVAVSRNEILEVEIQNGKENLVLTRTGNNLKENWTLSRENLPADSGEWNKTLNTLIELKASKIAAETTDNLAEFNLNKPFAKITFVKADKKRIHLTLGKTKQGLFARTDNRDTISEVDKTVEEKINLPSSHYHSKQIASFDRFEIKKIRWVRGSSSVEISKLDGSDWKFSDGDQTKIDSARVDSFLTNLQDIQLKKYLTKKTSIPSDPSSVTILLFENTAQDAKEALSLSLIKSAPNLALGRNSSVPYPFELAIEDYNKLNVFKQTLIKTEQKPGEADKLPKKS